MIQDEVPSALLDTHIKNVETAVIDGKSDPATAALALSGNTLCFMSVNFNYRCLLSLLVLALLTVGIGLRYCWNGGREGRRGQRQGEAGKGRREGERKEG